MVEILFITFYIIMFIVAILLSISSLKYFLTMWKFKNRKKDGSEDDQFKRLD